MYTPIFLKTENQLNKLVRQQKRTREPLSILFVSLWDKFSNDLVGKLKKSTGKKPVYIVNSFTMPHAFVIFHTTKLPHLVTLGRRELRSEDYLSQIYRSLGLESPRRS